MDFIHHRVNQLLFDFLISDNRVEEEKVARVYVECDTFNVKIDGDSLPNNQLIGEIVIFFCEFLLIFP